MFKGFGIVGMIFICLAILSKNKKQQNIFYLFGGFSLLTYSIYLRDFIFIILQIIVIFAVFYNLTKKYFKNEKNDLSKNK